jgi:ABC-type phosphate transport system substrate-binding protein
LKLYKKLAVAVGLVVGVTGTVYTAGPAGAATPTQDGKPEIIGAVGSDTIYWVSNNLMAAYNTDTTYNDGDRIVNIPPVITSPFPTGAVRPFDANSPCHAPGVTPSYTGSNSIIYDANNLPPNGSGAGITALQNDATGCINMARSSRVKGGSDLANDEFFAFALDALDWVGFPGGEQPANLTRQQIHDIYECDSTTHLPIIGDWSQIPGNGAHPGTIHKYAPQMLSGTYAFFKSQFLGGVDIDQNCDNAHKTTLLEEHDARGVASNNKAGAILPFSYAQWNSDKAGVTPDLRNGVVLKQLDGTTPSATTINEQSTGSGAGHFDGTRYVHYVLLRTNSLYADTVSFGGVDDHSNAGYICSGKGKTIIKLFGFTPLAKSSTGGNRSGSSFCRLNPAAL